MAEAEDKTWLPPYDSGSEPDGCLQWFFHIGLQWALLVGLGLLVWRFILLFVQVVGGTTR